MISLKFDRLSTREKFGLTLAAVFVFVALMRWVVAAPVLGVIQGMDDKIVELRSKLSVDASYVQQEPTIRAEYQKVKDLLGQTSSDAKAIDEMKGEIDDLARKHKVDVPSMEGREPRKKSYYYTEYFVEISSFESDTKDLLEFLKSVQDAPGMMRVVRLSVGPTRSATRVKGMMLLAKIMLHSSGRNVSTNQAAVVAGGPVYSAGSHVGDAAPGVLSVEGTEAVF